MNHKMISVFFFFIMSIVTLLLVHEYIYFKKQVDILYQLQEEYRVYTMIVKRVIEQRSDLEHNEKKTESDDSGLDDDCMQEDDTRDDPSFLLLNRDPLYLKESMIAHIQQENMEPLMQHIDMNNFMGYTDHLVAHAQQPTLKTMPQKIAPKNARKLSNNRTPSRLLVKKEAPDILLSWPIERNGFWLSSFFGPRKKPNGTWGYHYGVDMAALRGTPVKAAGSGVVVEAKYNKGYGKTVVIVHDKKYKTRYAHLDSILVISGQKILRGQLIGKVGDTGLVRKSGKDASHLHFEISLYGKKMNPLHFLS